MPHPRAGANGTAFKLGAGSGAQILERGGRPQALDPLGNCPNRKPDPVGKFQLALNIVKMRPHRTFRNPKISCDLLVRLTFGQPSKNIDLSNRQMYAIDLECHNSKLQ